MKPGLEKRPILNRFGPSLPIIPIFGFMRRGDDDLTSCKIEAFAIQHTCRGLNKLDRDSRELPLKKRCRWAGCRYRRDSFRFPARHCYCLRVSRVNTRGLAIDDCSISFPFALRLTFLSPAARGHQSRSKARPQSTSVVKQCQ